MALKKIVITRPDGTQTILKSGDQKTWSSLSKEEKYWILYVKNTEGECKDRSLNVNGTNYKPTYTTRKKRK